MNPSQRFLVVALSLPPDCSSRIFRCHCAEQIIDTDTSRNALETIERNARSQTQLIEDLLDISHIITGKLRLEIRQVELAQVIEAAIDAVRPAAAAKKIELLTAIDAEANLVSADPERLQQVMWNLLSNAIKFTTQGGRVSVLLERMDSNAQITVSDTGQGISREFLPYVFDRFRQADGSMTRVHGGLGLGLAIVRHLIELHGGTVTVNSPGMGQGTTFTVKLPLIYTDFEERRRSGQPLAEKSRASVLTQKLNGLRVLLVEDELDTRELFAMALKQYGAEVNAVDSATKALDALRQLAVDVLVSDIQMPEMDGYELIERVRTFDVEGVRGIPAIALTAYARTEDRTRSLMAGYQAHLSKPIEPTELVATVASLAGRTGQV